ncbi:hypothetical protein ACIF9R_38010, partial [Streptomyces sp. NPDC086080]
EYSGRAVGDEAENPTARAVGIPLLQEGEEVKSLAHLLWFGVVAVFFSHDRMRGLMLRGQKVLNKVIGSALAGLGVSLAFAPSH